MLSILLVLLLMSPMTQTPQPPTAPPRPAVPPAPPDVAAAPADAEKTASGLAHKLIAPGKGTVKPGPADVVVVQYTGWTADGKMFDSWALRARPSILLMDKVIPGWIEGLQLMTVGEMRRFWIPEALTFKGAEGRPKGTLTFDIELIDVSPPPNVAPPDVAAPPPDAKKTASGLSYKVMRGGNGTVKPKRTSRVIVHYTGWTTDGKMFDSSVAQQKPAEFAVTQVIEGWTEALQLMVAGDKFRLWIPENLAYKGQGPAPKGMLVFDVELIAVQ